MKQKKVTLRVAAAVLQLSLFTVLPVISLAQQKDTVKVLDEVLIKDSRVGETSPFTTSNISKQQLEEVKTEISIPYMLELQPSVVVSGENGKLGETSMRIRGVDATRINVNINGITLNDPESQSVFWYNVPNLGGMAQSIQIQRGVGTSNGGSSFGGAVNLQTLNPHNQPYGQAGLGFGSWNTRQYDIAAGSGVTSRGFSFDVAYNGQTTDGYVRGGWADQQSLFLTASRYGTRSLLKAVAVLGSQHTGITWNGEDAATLDLDPRHNSAGEYSDAFGNIYYYANESDNYDQHRYQLYYSYLLNDRWSLKAVGDYTHGDGYYEQYKAGRPFSDYCVDVAGSSDFIVRKQMLNDAYTGNVSAHYAARRFRLTMGQTTLYFVGDHFGNVIWCQDPLLFDTKADVVTNTSYEWYRNRADKLDATTFVRTDFDATDKLNLYADLQFRVVDYAIKGFVDDLFDINFREIYPFFNPKAGASYQFEKGSRIYCVAGISHREPTRSDIKAAVGRADTISSEAMLDIELGYQLNKLRWSASANAYAMLYRNQLTPSGDMNSSGYALMENVDKSYRLGVELVAGGRLTNWFRLDANATFSVNKIIDYTYTDFADGDTLLVTHTLNTDLAYSPNVVGAAIATFEPLANLKLQLIGKYVGSQYLDNTSRECYRQHAYFLLNGKVSYLWRLEGGNEIEAQFVVNNILNQPYRLGAWAADGYYGSYCHYAGWYQQPGLNFMARMVMRL